MRRLLTRLLRSAPAKVQVAGFRTKLLLAMMLVIVAVSGLTLYIAERNLAADIERQLRRDFEAELTALHQAQALRYAALVERCRALVGRPRIHAALEDDALDLLYATAADELRDVMPIAETPRGEAPLLRARFYRFLDRNGRVIPPPAGAAVGLLPPGEEAQLALPRLGDRPAMGYLVSDSGPRPGAAQIIATPIISTETDETIAALVLGFRPLGPFGNGDTRNGIWSGGRLFLPGVDAAGVTAVAHALAAAVPQQTEGTLRVRVGGGENLLFFKSLNQGDLYPPAFEVALYSLAAFSEREAQLRLRVVALGAVLIAASFLISHFLAARLSAPVERLAVESERSARFSANASHQLKTPVTVLRAGLEELMAREHLTPDECAAISALIHQTYRLSSLIEDLLLLSRMDSGRLQLSLGSVDLAHLIAAALDDLSAAPDDKDIEIETDLPPRLEILGEQRYTAIVLQNLLENARKYNRAHGRIRVSARLEGPAVFLTIANTGQPIAPAAQAHIFERFHRGAMGEDVPGYGLGLNLARELARLHRGELRLVRSDAEWTVFELTFLLAETAVLAR